MATTIRFTKRTWIEAADKCWLKLLSSGGRDVWITPRGNVRCIDERYGLVPKDAVWIGRYNKSMSLEEFRDNVLIAVKEKDWVG